MSALILADDSQLRARPMLGLGDAEQEFVSCPVVPSEDSSCCSRVYDCLSYLRNSSVVKRAEEVAEYGPAVSDTISVVSSTAHAREANVFMDLIWTTGTSTAENTPSGFSETIRMAEYLKVALSALAPYALVCTISEAIGMAGKHKIDSGLRAMDGLAWTAESTATFVSGLNLLGYVGEGAAAVASTVIGASWGVSSMATALLNMKHLIQSNNFFNELENQSSDDVIKAVQNLDEYAINKHLNVKSDQLRQKLDAITKIAAEATPDTSQRILDKTSKLLKERVQYKMFSNKLSILSSIITLIAVSILLFSPLAPVAYGCMAIASLISLVKFFYERHSISHFQISLDKLATDQPIYRSIHMPIPPVMIQPMFVQS